MHYHDYCRPFLLFLQYSNTDPPNGTHPLLVSGATAGQYISATAAGQYGCDTAVDKDGIFHRLSEEMATSLLAMCMKYMSATRTADHAAVKAQREAKRVKEELARAAGMAKGQEAFIDALYYRDMYDSPACWKTAAAVDRELARLKSKTAQLDALKQNIRMRVVGLGWKDLATAWSKDGKEFTPAQLAAHLKTIIVAGRSRDIPSKPPLPLPARKELPTLGTQSRDAAALDVLQLAKGADFEMEARRTWAEREAAGVGDIAAERQQQTAPLVDKALLGKRLEVCFIYDLADGSGSEPRWSAGKVVLISDGTNIKPKSKFPKGEAVMIRWDDPWEPTSERDKRTEEERRLSAVRLLKSKWNPKSEQGNGAWRFDPDHL